MTGAVTVGKIRVGGHSIALGIMTGLVGVSCGTMTCASSSTSLFPQQCRKENTTLSTPTTRKANDDATTFLDL